MDFKALSKTLTLIENGRVEDLSLLKKLYARKRGVPILGVTGLPGAGKSTLVDHCIQLLRSRKKTVGVIAIDPSSPFTGGALLGDRVRMQRHASDEGVFIRSVGSRGAHGGLAHAARNMALVFDSHGFDQILVETVGVGQTELDIMGLATTTVVILMPESGDVIQTLKAGLTEIADIFVVNKMDRSGAEPLQRMLQAIGDVPVLLTQASAGKGIAELWGAVEKHREALKNDPAHAQHQQTLCRAQFLELVGDHYRQKILDRLNEEPKWKSLLEKVANETLNPFEALEKILKDA